MPKLPIVLALLVLLAPPARSQSGASSEHQILWQRNLPDALALAKAEHRPLLVALNMDGESACERIVHGRYRDPKFVAWTRPFVCVIGSVFRHTPRDFDDEGRRIPCPRLGEITCGEHIALEPAIFDGYLAADHERVAPRHALILPDGKKAWDLYLLFDLRDLDRQLEASVKQAPALTARGPDPRRVLEERLLAATDSEMITAVEAIGAQADAGSLGALQIALARARNGSAPLRTALIATARSSKLEKEVAGAARSFVCGLGPFPGASKPSGEEHLLPLMAELDGASPATRSLLLACWSLGSYGTEAQLALETAFHDAPLVREALAKDSPKTLELLESTEALLATSSATASGSWTDTPLTPAPEIERELARLEPELQKRPDDAALAASYGLACLGLARRRMETNGSGANLLLEDADRWLKKAIEGTPQGKNEQRFEWLVNRARASYLLGRFEQQQALAEEAYAEATARALASFSPPQGDQRRAESVQMLLPLCDARIIEARRWVGDACARLLAKRSGADPVAEAHGIELGIRMLGLVALSPQATGDDWVTYASLYGALGLWREEFAALQQGALRFPASQPIRQSMNNSLWNGGRIDLAPFKADWIARKHQESADAAWFAAYAWILAAENERRCERPEPAIKAYAAAQKRFQQAIALEPKYEASSNHYIALAWLGSGMAHLLADRRQEAADALVHGIAVEPAVATARDGLDREALDLLDQALEWRESGPSKVDVRTLLEQLEKADASSPFWARSISDSELREALRADGRVGEPGTTRLPSKEGDAYLKLSIEAARRAHARADTEEDRRALAQALTIWAERCIARSKHEDGQRELAEAAVLMGLEAPAGSADRATLERLAQELRSRLGEPRPIVRPGR